MILGDVISVLISDATLLALVDSARIVPVKRDQGAAGTAVVVDYDNIKSNPTKDTASQIDFADTIITAYASTPLQAQNIADAIRGAMDNYRTVIDSERYEFRFTTARTGYDRDNEEVYTVEMEYWTCYTRLNETDAAAAAQLVLTGFRAYLAGFATPPTLLEEITGGAVWTYLHVDGVTRYRFIPSPYVAANDKFYAAYDAGTDTLSTELAANE